MMNATDLSESEYRALRARVIAGLPAQESEQPAQIAPASGEPSAQTSAEWLAEANAWHAHLEAKLRAQRITEAAAEMGDARNLSNHDYPLAKQNLLDAIS